MSAEPTIVNNSLLRLRYFFGQLLTQRDLAAEQTFHLQLQRLVQRETFGTGTVAGLRVVGELDSVAVPQSVFVLPGLAFDPDGRELLLEKPVVVAVASVPLASNNNPFPSDPGNKTDLAAAVDDRFSFAFTVTDLDDLVTRLADVGLMTEPERLDYFNNGTITVIRSILERLEDSTPVITPPATPVDWLFGQLVGVSYLGIRYAEQGVDPAPAAGGDACCAGTTCFSTRAQEGIAVLTSSTPFPEVPNPFEDFETCLAGDREQICECLLDAWRGFPAPTSDCGPVATPVVPLAIVYWSIFEQSPAQILPIDNCSVRPLAPGGPMLRALGEIPV